MSKKNKIIEIREEFEIETDMEPEIEIIEEETLQPKWIIDADLTETQLKEAYRLLDSGMKVRRVALHLGIHKKKIRATI